MTLPLLLLPNPNPTGHNTIHMLMNGFMQFLYVYYFPPHFITESRTAKNASRKADVARVLIGVIVKRVAAML